MGAAVTNIGSSSTVIGGTVTLTVTGVPAGAHTVVGASWNGTATAGSVADTAGNTYLISSPSGAQANNNNGALGAGAFYRQRTGVALNNGDTIVFTLPAGATTATVDACYVTGLRATGSDTASFYASNFGNNTAPTVTSGTPIAEGEIAFAMVTASTTIASFTQDTTNAAWGTSPPAGSISNTAPVLGVGFAVNGGSGTMIYAPTLGTSVPWATTIVGYLVQEDLMGQACL